MGYVQRLELTLRRSGDPKQFTPVHVSADPEDVDKLQEMLRQIAEDQDGRKWDGWAWQHEYAMKVVCPDSPWIEPFEVAGKDVE